MFDRKPNNIDELRAIEAAIAEKERKLVQLKTSLRDAQTKLEVIRKEINTAETEREHILDLFVEGKSVQGDLDKTRKHFDRLVMEERDLKDIIEATEAVISRIENEIPPLRRQKTDIERLIWIAASEEIKRELRTTLAPAVLRGIAVQKLLGSPVHSQMIADLFFPNGLPSPEEITTGEHEIIKKYLS